MKKPRHRMARIIARLQQYNFTIQHRSGKTHTDCDGLSRVDDHNLTDPVMIPPSTHISEIHLVPACTDDLCSNSSTLTPYHEPYTHGRINLNTLAVSYYDVDTPETYNSSHVNTVATSLDCNIPSHLCDFDLELRERQETDPTCIAFKSLIQTGNWPDELTASREREYTKYLKKHNVAIHHGLIMVKCITPPEHDRRPWKRYLPESLVTSILNEFHNTSMAGGHLGPTSMLNKISQLFAWIKME